MQTEPIEPELVSEVREIRQGISGPSHAQLLRRGLLIGLAGSSGRSATESRSTLRSFAADFGRAKASVARAATSQAPPDNSTIAQVAAATSRIDRACRA